MMKMKNSQNNCT